MHLFLSVKYALDTKIGNVQILHYLYGYIYGSDHYKYKLKQIY